MNKVTMLSNVNGIGTSPAIEFYETEGPWEAVIQTSGDYTSAINVAAEITVDGTNYDEVVPSIASGDIWIGPLPGGCAMRLLITGTPGSEVVTAVAGIHGDGRIRFVDTDEFVPTPEEEE